MPRAATAGDRHVCHGKSPAPHRGGPVISGCPTVLFAERLAARVGDTCECVGAKEDVIAQGCPTVLVAGKPAARKGDRTDGGLITSGLRTVRIGREARRGRRP